MNTITELCTACRACEQLCTHGAISMVADDEGFLTAQIDPSLCVDCGLCTKRCPQNERDERKEKSEEPQTFAIRLRDDEILYRSASGGAFAGIAKAWIEDGGVVFGVVYDSEWRAHHVCSSTIDELMPILSSKYVQADTRDTYKEVKRLLADGRKVLYSGTACQIGGLKSYLGHHQYAGQLLTIDLICHGVTSPLLFQQYIKWLSQQVGAPISEYDFRDKRGGWGLGYKYKYKYKYKSCTVDPYYMRFLEGEAYRECCYSCRYASVQRPGDLTIGDYWGIEREHPLFFNTKGVSCILINNAAGEAIWKRYGSLFYSQESTFGQVARHNHNLLRPTTRPALRNTIYKGINTDRDWFASHMAATFHPSLLVRIKALMPMWVRLIVKRLK